MGTSTKHCQVLSSSTDYLVRIPEHNNRIKRGGEEMQSLHTRLDPIKEAVLKVTKLFGRGAAMSEFEVADYACFSVWLEEVTHDKNFGLRPQICIGGGQTIAGQLAVKVVRTLLDLQTENERLKAELRQVKLQQSRNEGTPYDEALAVLEVCQV